MFIEALVAHQASSTQCHILVVLAHARPSRSRHPCWAWWRRRHPGPATHHRHALHCAGSINVTRCFCCCVSARRSAPSAASWLARQLASGAEANPGAPAIAGFSQWGAGSGRRGRTPLAAAPTAAAPQRQRSPRRSSSTSAPTAGCASTPWTLRGRSTSSVGGPAASAAWLAAECSGWVGGRPHGCAVHNSAALDVCPAAGVCTVCKKIPLHIPCAIDVSRARSCRHTCTCRRRAPGRRARSLRANALCTPR